MLFRIYQNFSEQFYKPLHLVTQQSHLRSKYKDWSRNTWSPSIKWSEIMKNVETMPDGIHMFPLHIVQVSTPTEYTARTVVSICVNGVRDVRSVFHKVFFCAWTWRILNSTFEFLTKRNKINVQIENELFELWGDAAYKKSTEQKWTKRFREGRKRLQDSDRVDHPSTSLTDEKVEEVHELIWSDQHLTVCEIAKECHTSYGPVQSILIEKWQKENNAKLHLPIFIVVTHYWWTINLFIID